MIYPKDNLKKIYSGINNPIELIQWYIPVHGSVYLKLLYENEFDYKEQLAKELNEKVFDNRFNIIHSSLNQLELINKPHFELVQFYTRLKAFYKPLKLNLYAENSSLYAQYGFEIFDYILFEDVTKQIDIIGTNDEKREWDIVSQVKKGHVSWLN